MRLISLFIVTILLPIVYSVHIDDAFVKDWVKRFHNPFTKYDIISDGTLIGLTSDNKFVLTDPINENNIRWTIDLTKLSAPIDNYQLSPNSEYAYLYSNISNQVFAYETKTGIFINSYNFKLNIQQIKNSYGDSLLVLDSSGKLYSLSHGIINLVNINDSIDDFLVTQYNGREFILYNGKFIVELNHDLEVVGNVNIEDSNITHFQNGIYISNEKIFKLTNNEQLSIEYVSSISSSEGIELIDNEYLVSYNNSDLSIFRIESNGLTLIKKETFNKITSLKLLKKALNTVLIVSYKSISEKPYDAILNLSDFLVDQDNMITTFRVASLHSNYFISFKDELSVIGISQSTEEFVVSRLNLNSGEHDISKFDIYSTKSPYYILMDKPISENTISKVHHILDDVSSSFLMRWITRLFRHLSNFGEYMTSFFVELDTSINKFAEEDTFGFQKLLIFIDEPRKRLIAINSKDGSLFWKSSRFDISSPIIDIIELDNSINIIFENGVQIIDSRTGESENSKYYDTRINKAIKIKNSSGIDTLLLGLSSGDYVTYNGDLLDDDQYFVESNEEEVIGFKINQQKKKNTWSFNKPGEQILKLSTKATDSKTQSVGIALSDKSILYKYLYPNVITVFTRSENTLKLYLIDSITGILLYNFNHPSDELINFDSIKIAMDDNWIIYSYFVQSPRIEQRINVIDLFDTKKAIGDEDISSLNHNITIDSIYSKSYIFPEVISSLTSTQTAFGITVKSILVVTENGKLYEIQKSLLNGRRIDDRELTPEDFKNDFRVIPYEPVVGLFTYQILNHRHQLLTDESGRILVKPTNLESTLVVCYVNKDNIFSTYISPSLSYDSLGHKFDKIKLLLTIAGIFICYIISIPFVSNKKLNSIWIDRP